MKYELDADAGGWTYIASTGERVPVATTKTPGDVTGLELILAGENAELAIKCVRALRSMSIVTLYGVESSHSCDVTDHSVAGEMFTSRDGAERLVAQLEAQDEHGYDFRIVEFKLCQEGVR
jgi:hypothetical protein